MPNVRNIFTLEVPFSSNTIIRFLLYYSLLDASY